MNQPTVIPEANLVIECRRDDLCEAMRRAFKGLDNDALTQSLMTPVLALMASGMSQNKKPRVFETAPFVKYCNDESNHGNKHAIMCRDMAMVIAVAFVDLTLVELEHIKSRRVKDN